MPNTRTSEMASAFAVGPARRRTSDAGEQEGITAEEYRSAVSEKAFQAAVIEAAQALNWLVVHIRAMLGNDPGLPDLLLWRNDQYALIELKSERGTVSARQRRWHETAAAHGVTVHVFRPSDWERIDAVLRGEGP